MCAAVSWLTSGSACPSVGPRGDSRKSPATERKTNVFSKASECHHVGRCKVWVASCKGDVDLAEKTCLKKGGAPVSPLTLVCAPVSISLVLSRALSFTICLVTPDPILELHSKEFIQMSMRASYCLGCKKQCSFMTLIYSHSHTCSSSLSLSLSSSISFTVVRKSLLVVSGRLHQDWKRPCKASIRKTLKKRGLIHTCDRADSRIWLG